MNDDPNEAFEDLEDFAPILEEPKADAASYEAPTGAAAVEETPDDGKGSKGRKKKKAKQPKEKRASVLPTSTPRCWSFLSWR